MRILLILFALACFNIANCQVSKSYSFQYENVLSGSFISKHPTENSSFTATMKNNGTNEPIISLAKLDSVGNTLWYSNIQEASLLSTLASINDIIVNSNNIYISANYFLPEKIGRIYKYDLLGNFIDSTSITDPEGMDIYRGEMAFNSDNELCFTYKDFSDTIKFYTLDPNSLSILTETNIEYNTTSSTQSYRWTSLAQDGTSTVVAYTKMDTIKFVSFDSNGIQTSAFTYYNGPGFIADFEVISGNYISLINASTSPATPGDNPVNIVEFDPTGTVINNDSYTGQIPNWYTDIAFDGNMDLYVVGRGPQTGLIRGTVLKITSSIQYEVEIEDSKLCEIEFSSAGLISSGNCDDTKVDCQDNFNGQVFLTFSTDETPMAETISPTMTLSINNITPLISCVSSNFQDVGNGVAAYYIDGVGDHTIYGFSLLIAAQDAGDALHSSSSQFYNLYATGPITNQNDYDQTERDIYDRVWIITKQQVDNHINAFVIGDASYKTPEVILNWPAHGDPSKGQESDLARFKDINNNGIYDPLEGEYPLIKGDYCALSIYNDVVSDTAENCHSTSERLGVQVYEYLYGFECGQDSSLQNTIYTYYEIINSSGEDYDSMFVGNYIDYDIEFPQDDYIGSDPDRGLVYAMNGDFMGPEQGYTILGSKQNNNGQDDAFGIDSMESINGYGYGDGIADNERKGMTNSMYRNLGGGAMGDPNTPSNFYNAMMSQWNDGTHQTYGGNGYASSAFDADYCFPDGDDSNFDGTGGVDPGSNWSELNEGNPVGDRRIIASSGPFDLENGDTLFFDIAHVTGVENTTGGYTSHEALQINTDSARSYFYANQTPCGQDYDFYEPFDGPYTTIGLKEDIKPIILVYPNPTEGSVFVENLPINGQIFVYGINGKLIYSGIIQNEKVLLNTSNYPKGTYIIQAIGNGQTEHCKFIKL